MELSDLKTDTFDLIYNDLETIIYGFETIILFSITLSLIET